MFRRLVIWLQDCANPSILQLFGFWCALSWSEQVASGLSKKYLPTKLRHRENTNLLINNRFNFYMILRFDCFATWLFVLYLFSSRSPGRLNAVRSKTLFAFNKIVCDYKYARKEIKLNSIIEPRHLRWWKNLSLW